MNSCKSIRIFFISIIFLLPNLISAKDVEQLPNDPRIKVGKLANGLSYYIIKNKAVKGYADFCIAQKSGTSLEEKGQEGMCKALELLSTRGTRNFTDSTITSYLRSIGLESKDLIFRTNPDDITYIIKNVPVTNSNVADSSLLILYNWLGSINIDEEDINNIMPVLKNTIAGQWDAEGRLDSRTISQLFPDSRYTREFNIDNIKNLKPFSSKDLRTFYYKWFRPDLQAVFIVGDIDPAEMETKVKSTFATLPKPIKSEKIDEFIPEKFNDIKIILENDPEYNKTTVKIDLLKEPLKKKYKNTIIPYVENYMDDAISSLLSNRIQEGIVTQNIPITNVEITQGKYMGIHNLERFTISFQTQPQSVYQAINYLSTELDRLGKYGFNSQEFSSSINMYYRKLEKLYNNREELKNEFYLNRALKNFLDDGTLASVEMNFEVMKEVLFSLTANQLNTYAQSLLGQKKNLVLTCKMPKAKGLDLLSKERMLYAFNNAIAVSPSSYLESGVIKWPTHILTGSQGSIVSESIDPLFNAKLYTLSNGAKVILNQKPETKDTVAFVAVSKGGSSLMRNIYNGNSKTLNEIINLGGYGDMSQTVLEKLYSYHNLYLRSFITDNSEGLMGYAGNKDKIEKLCQLIYLAMTQRKPDERAFNVYKRTKLDEAQYHKLSPYDVFLDSVSFYNNSNKNYISSTFIEQINILEYPPIYYASKERFSNPGDFIFVFCGDVDELEFKDYITKYIASIPTGNGSKENWVIYPSYLTKGKTERRFLHQMVVPRTYVSIVNTYSCKYNIENYVLSNLLKEYLKRLYYNGAIKNLSSKTSVKTDLLFYPEDIMIEESFFETDSAGSYKIVDIVKESISEISNKGINEVLFSSIKEDLTDIHNSQKKTNSYWTEEISRKYFNGADFVTEYEQILNSISSEKFSNFIRQFFNDGNQVIVVMEGTTNDVSTQNLLKENVFIRDFFDI